MEAQTSVIAVSGSLASQRAQLLSTLEWFAMKKASVGLTT
jgi:hypothetical protein